MTVAVAPIRPNGRPAFAAYPPGMVAKGIVMTSDIGANTANTIATVLASLTVKVLLRFPNSHHAAIQFGATISEIPTRYCVTGVRVTTMITITSGSHSMAIRRQAFATDINRECLLIMFMARRTASRI